MINEPFVDIEQDGIDAQFQTEKDAEEYREAWRGIAKFNLVVDNKPD